MTTRKRGPFSLVFLLVLLPMIHFGACSSTDPRQEALDAARALWASNHMSHYRFRYWESMYGSFGPASVVPPAIVEVREGVVVSATTVVDQNPFDPSLLHYFDSIEMVFDRIQFRIDRGNDFSVQYNPELGYPEQVVYPVVEGNVTIRASDVERLE